MVWEAPVLLARLINPPPSLPSRKPRPLSCPCGVGSGGSTPLSCWLECPLPCVVWGVCEGGVVLLNPPSLLWSGLSMVSTPPSLLWCGVKGGAVESPLLCFGLSMVSTARGVGSGVPPSCWEVLVGSNPWSFQSGVSPGGREASLVCQTIVCGRRFCSETLGCPFKCLGRPWRFPLGTIQYRVRESVLMTSRPQ